MSAYDPYLIRKKSLSIAKTLGVQVSSTLPVLETGLKIRDVNEVVSRMLAMHAVAAVAYGFDSAKAIVWLEQESLIDSLTDEEREFVFQGKGQADRFKAQIEAMWALAWAMGIVSELDFGKDCDDNFVRMLPNLRQMESSATFRKKISLRTLQEVIAALDLAYCLHWAVREARGNLKPYLVIERRRALEWLLSEESWNNVPLDT